jgi:hypothetical protein
MIIKPPTNLSHIWDTFEIIDISYDDFGQDRSNHILDTQAKLLEYISEINDGHSIPLRSHLNPSKIINFLPRIMLLAQSDDEISVRLSGTAIDTLYGNITGKNIDNLNDDNLAKYWKVCVKRILGTRKPIIASSKINLNNIGDYSIRKLIIPFSNDGKNINQFLFLFDLIK